MRSKRSYTQTQLAENLESWHSRRRGGERELSEWERDTVFMKMALTLWPVDMEAATSNWQQSARMRLRLRWEGFNAIKSARKQLVALINMVEEIKAELEFPKGD